MDLSSIFLYIAIGSAIVSILWLIYISIDVKKERDTRRKEERDEKVKVKVDDLSEETANVMQVNIDNGSQIVTVKIPETGVVTAEQVLAAIVVPKVNASTRSPKIRRANFKAVKGYKKTVFDSRKVARRIVLKEDELA